MLAMWQGVLLVATCRLAWGSASPASDACNHDVVLHHGDGRSLQQRTLPACSIASGPRVRGAAPCLIAREAAAIGGSTMACCKREEGGRGAIIILCLSFVFSTLFYSKLERSTSQKKKSERCTLSPKPWKPPLLIHLNVIQYMLFMSKTTAIWWSYILPVSGWLVCIKAWSNDFSLVLQKKWWQRKRTSISLQQ